MEIHANPVYTLNNLVEEIGEVGVQMTDIGVAEGSAGNISAFVRHLEGIDWRFRDWGSMPLPVKVPALVDGWVVVSGTGRRLRDIARRPETTLCLLNIHADGESATLFAATELRPTSEISSHLAIHNDRAICCDLSFHAVVHTQPPYLTYLSHLPAYSDTRSLNRRLMRWEPETIVTFPEGLGLLPFQVPGSLELMAATLEGLRNHRAVVWQRHGIVTRSDDSVHKAGDLVEYAETAAHFEYINLLNPHPVEGLSDEEIVRVCQQFNVKQTYFE
jgi:rhamnulose-1-phosphate aldolase